MAMPLKSADMERWAHDALALPADQIGYSNVPFSVLVDEAVEVANFVEKRWAPEGDAQAGLPGLEAVAGKGVARTLHAGFATELRSLQRAAADAHTNYAALSKLDESPAARGRRVLRELRAALEFVLDDGVSDESDQYLAGLAAKHESEPSTLAKLALAIDGYHALASLHRFRLEALPGFLVAMLDEARSLSEQLRGSTAIPVAASPETQAALELRDRYATLVQQRMNAVRATARYVYRDHPEIVREVTSHYERRKRAASRRAMAETPVVGVRATKGAADPVAE